MFGKKHNKVARRQPATDDSQRRNSVFSYYASRSDDTERGGRSPKDSASSSSMSWLKNLPVIIALVIIITGLAYTFSLDNNNPNVLLASPADEPVTSIRDQQDYYEGAREILSSSWLNRSKVTIDTDDFSRKFADKFPEVSSATVALPLVGRRPVITIDIADPVLLINTTQNNQADLVLDSRGRVMLLSNELVSSVRDRLPLVNDQSGTAAEVGDSVLPSDDIQFIRQVIQQFDANEVPIETITLPPLPNELHVKPQNVPYHVKFNIENDAREAVGTYLALRQELNDGNTTPSEYIDVRVEERAFYR